MKRKLGFLMTLVIALCTSSAWAQSVISVGTNLDFSEGTPVDNGICTYAKDMGDNGTTYSQMLEVAGWTIEGENGDARAAGLFTYGSGYWLGGKGYNVPATNSAGVAEGNALGIVAVWSATAQYTQLVTLEAGDYVISVPVYNAVGGTSAPTKSLIGFIADNGTEYLAPAKAYAVDTWTVENIKFTLTEATTGKLSLGYAAPNAGSGGNQHLFFDKVEIMAVTETDLARIDLNAALVTAQATVDAKAGVGAGIFMYSEEVYNTYAAAVAAAKAVSEKAEATVDELKAAVAALNAATAAYTVTIPAADAIYAIKHNASGNFLNITDKISIETAVDTLSFEAANNGKYYIKDNAGKYIYYSGTGDNKWSLSASADKKDEWTVSVNAEGLYSLVGKNGGLGTDNVGAGSNCYGNKDKAAANSLWTIAEILIEDEPGNEGDDDVVVAEGNLIENPGFEKWEGGNPVNWAGVGHNATIKQSADAKSGSYAVEVAGANANKRLASQAYTLKPGTYKYSVNVKQTGDAAGMYRLGYIKLTDGAIANSSTDYIYITEPAPVSAEWSEVSCEFTLEAATEIALVVMNSKNGKGASILVDDVVLTTNNGGNEGGDDEGEEEQKPISGTIAEVVAAGVQASASTSGTVVATYARGFLIGDGTGYVLTYLGKDSGLAVGDVVTVAGATSMYGGLLQFGNTSTFEKTGTATFTQPDPEVLDGAVLDAYLAAPVIKYVQYTGTLAISGNYYNVTVDGAQKAVGSIQYAPEGLVDASLDGQKIVVTGYSIGVSSSKYVNTMGVSVVAAEEEPAVKTDYTDAIVNADLSTTEAWDASQTKGIKDGMVKVGGNVFDFTQTITLPAGQYKMTVKAAYRYANSTKPEEEYEYNQIQAGVETHLAKLYAETSSYKYEANVMNRCDGASDTDFANGSGSVTVNGKFVPNSSAAVQAWFDAGQYVNELIFNVQEDGAVKIGIAKTENCPDGDYTNIGAWTLTRLGDAEADPKEEPTPEESPYFADGDYLIVNTETGYYLGGGNDWGTHASLLGKPQFFTFAHQGDNAYTLDSHQSNGGDSHFLGTGLYCDAAAANWTFAKTENGNYTINNAGNYLAGNGTNKVIITVTEPTAAAEWTIISKAEAIAALDAATVEAPADATIYVNNPEFKRNAGGWTVTSADGTGTPSNYAFGSSGNTANCAESYHSTNGFDLSQVLVGMKPGVYRLDGHAFYRNDGDNTGAFPYFYVNDQQSLFPELTGSENSMAAAYASFLNGSYAIVPIYFTVAEGDEVKVGVHGDNTAFWNIWGELGLTYYGADASIAEVKASSVYAEYRTVIGKPMNAEVLATMEASKAAYEADSSEDNLAAFTAAVAAATASVNVYAISKPAIDAMFALMQSTNVYTAEAYAIYSAKAEEFLAQYEAGTLTAAVDNPATIHGWRASVDYDDLLLSAFGVKDFDTDLYINTWSTEGEADGSEFKVPFFEYWTEDANSLGANTKTATMTGLTPGQYYSVEAWVRTRAKNGVAAADATGITLSVGAGEEVDVTEGVVVGESQFAHAVYTAIGAADENGTLTISFNVLADNNVSWLSFKNLKYTEVEMLNVVGAKVGDVALVEGAATVESISTIDVTFDRPVALAENAGWATLADSWGPTNLKAEVLAENACVVRFTVSDEFGGEFTEAGDYALNIPAGFIVDAENGNCGNATIEAVITIKAAPATPLAVVNVTVGENVVEGFSVEAKPTDMIKVNFDGPFYFQGTPVIVDAEGNDASEHFMYANGLDVDGSNAYILQGMKDGIYTITLPKASFMEMMQWKAPAEDIVLTVKIVTEGEGIDNIAVDADAVIYDLSGKRVQGNVKSLERGIYIVNGKKFFVK